jgi:hypothetical protein
MEHRFGQPDGRSVTLDVTFDLAADVTLTALAPMLRRRGRR